VSLFTLAKYLFGWIEEAMKLHVNPLDAEGEDYKPEIVDKLSKEKKRKRDRDVAPAHHRLELTKKIQQDSWFETGMIGSSEEEGEGARAEGEQYERQVSKGD
jgi:hypothetical protein